MELIYQNRYETRKQAELSIFEYIEGFYNTHGRYKWLKNRAALEFNQLIINKFKKMKVLYLIIYLFLNHMLCFSQTNEYSRWQQKMKNNGHLKEFLRVSIASKNKIDNNYYGNDFNLLKKIDNLMCSLYHDF